MTSDQSTVNNHIDPLLRLMQEHNIPINRENYLTLMFMGDPPDWSAEYESEMPEFLQDWESKSFGPSKKEPTKPSALGQKAFHSLTLEEIEELGNIT
jgi:hypothetical protein